MANLTHLRAVGLVFLFALLASPASAQTPRQKSYPVSALEIAYALEHPRQPAVAELLDLEVEMRVTRGGLMQPHPTALSTRFRLGEIPPDTRIWTTGLHHLTQQILAEFERRDIGGVILTLPDLEEGSGRDLRAPGETRLRIHVWTGRVENVVTVADGPRFAGTLEERSNRPEHDWVRQGSPVTAGGDGALIEVSALEDYTLRLSRHPGRRVDAKLRPGQASGASVLEYHVAETKPWIAYAQYSNTGTRATGHARQRFGFAHNQLTGRDDVLRLDYSTGSFDQVHGVFGSYDTPLDDAKRVRLRAFGSWSRYDDAPLGDTGLLEFCSGLGGPALTDCEGIFTGVEFSGEQWEVGSRLGLEVLQRGAWFVDVFATGRWREASSENENAAGDPVGGFANGRADFFLLGGGALLSYDDWITRLDLGASFEANLPGVTGTNTQDLIELGRVAPDTDFQLLRWNGELGFYIEPILYYGRGFGDPGSAARSTLAHEVVIRTLGQWSLGNRLVPQFQQVAGGMHTVRGYRQSVTAGDSAAIGSAEYRLHLARLIDPGGEPVEVPVIGPFQVRPRTVFSRADWDLLLKLFFDAGQVWSPSGGGQDRSDETLAAWGIGAELQLLTHLRVGVDLAWLRSGLSNGTRPDLSPRTHVFVTLTF